MKYFKDLREEFLLEVLKSSDPASKWISDFVHSNDPKFKGKSKKERIRMALGAKYAAMRSKKGMEEGSLNELDDRLEGIGQATKRIVKRDIVGERVAEETKHYSLVHKATNKVLSTHKDLESAKDKHRGMDQGERAHYRIATSTKEPKLFNMKEEKEFNKIQHYCAKHVYSDIFGEGIVLESEHAEPDNEGNIDWYTVQFNHGNEVVFTEDLDILIAEYHDNHKKKKKKNKDIQEKLHPNQKKLDVAEPKGKLTADDFHKLRAMKKKG